MAHISEVSDAQLFAELDNCKIAKVLLSKTAYKKQWQTYENAIKYEIKLRNEQFANMSDEDILEEIMK